MHLTLPIHCPCIVILTQTSVLILEFGPLNFIFLKFCHITLSFNNLPPAPRFLEFAHCGLSTFTFDCLVLQVPNSGSAPVQTFTFACHNYHFVVSCGLQYHGGTNFGRTSGDFVTTSYDYDAPIDEYGELFLHVYD